MNLSPLRDALPAWPRALSRLPALPRLPKLGAQRVRIPFVPEEVTTRNKDAEADPREVGMSLDGARRIWDAVGRLYRTGLYPAVAFCLRRRGRVVLDGAIGHARGNGPQDAPGTALIPATPSTLFPIFSASKAVTAIVIHLLNERGLVHLDDAVCEYIPEFGNHGKEWITIRHVLTHRAGIPTLPGVDVDLDLLLQPAKIIERLCEATPVWTPGRRLAYHALTGGFVLGEIVHRVTGRDIRRFLREEILDPLHFDAMDYGAAPEMLPDLAESVFTGYPIAFPLSWVVRRAIGVPFQQACEIANDPRFLTAIIPAGNVIATANEASRFFQLLLSGGELDGVRVLEGRTLRRVASEQSYLEVDLTLGFPVRYGLGMMLGAKRVSLFGPDTEKAFGHLGFTNVVTCADPERETALCLMTSGKPFIAPEVWRVYDVMRQVVRHCPKA